LAALTRKKFPLIKLLGVDGKACQTLKEG
jgi:hypothetical protein